MNLMLAATAGSSAGTNSSTGLKLTRQEIFTLAEKYGPKALGALVLIVIGLFLARWIGGMVMKALLKREMEPPLRMLFVRLVKLVILLISLMMAIQQLGFELLPLIAGLGVAGVGVGLAMQGVLSNLVAGLTIIFVKKFRVGEYVELNGVHGLVDTIELFSTTLIHPDRSRVIIPNRKIVGEIIHNYGKIRQLNLSVGVAYETDLGRAIEVVRQVLAHNERVLKDPAPVVGTATMGDSSIVIAVKPWTAVGDFGPAAAEINKALVEAFRQSKISIPFPQCEIRVLGGSEIRNVA